MKIANERLHSNKIKKAENILIKCYNVLLHTFGKSNQNEDIFVTLIQIVDLYREKRNMKKFEKYCDRLLNMKRICLEHNHLLCVRFGIIYEENHKFEKANECFATYSEASKFSSTENSHCNQFNLELLGMHYYDMKFYNKSKRFC